MDSDTIVAIATAPGRGGIGIVRLSGAKALAIATSITHIKLLPRYAHLCPFHDGAGRTLDSGICLFFPGPGSFTGEDVVELQGHGSPVVLDLLLREVCLLGARQANPGEFSQRAYMNNKIDLTQAEAIADLINATTERAALNASHSLQGIFSKKINALVALVTSLRVYVEAAIDFPEEEIDFIQSGQVREKLAAIVHQFDVVANEAKQGTLVQEGVKIVITGKPNAGKSSLLNALAGRNRAIVTAIEGTTRDVLYEHIQIGGMPLHIVDTAGLRDSEDEIEREGIRRAWTEIASADHILLVIDGDMLSGKEHDYAELSHESSKHLEREVPVTIVSNKCDLSDRDPEIYSHGNMSVVHLSAKTGAGVDLLKRHLQTTMGYDEVGEGHFSARRRHLLSLEQAKSYLLAGQQQLQLAGAGELLAEDLRLCQNSLGEITGAVSSDELLGSIFSSFCIGK